MTRSGLVRQPPPAASAVSISTTRTTRSGQVLRPPLRTSARKVSNRVNTSSNNSAERNVARQSITDPAILQPRASVNKTQTRRRNLLSQPLNDASTAQEQPRTSTNIMDKDSNLRRPARNVRITKRQRTEEPNDTSDDDNPSDTFNPGDHSDSDRSSLRREEEEHESRPSARRRSGTDTNQVAASNLPQDQIQPSSVVQTDTHPQLINNSNINANINLINRNDHQNNRALTSRSQIDLPTTCVY
ncbi:hypothetical protein DFH28DRAFT_1137225 [Melampsora americana]|nr:hypothetical protein DFH28DRAFT_1137225 [Melampsora americana]